MEILPASFFRLWHQLDRRLRLQVLDIILYDLYTSAVVVRSIHLFPYSEFSAVSAVSAVRSVISLFYGQQCMIPLVALVESRAL